MTTPTPYVNERISPAELRGMFQVINERLDLFDGELATIHEGLTAAAGQPQTAPAATGQTVDFQATTLLVGVDDNGAPTYKAKGGQYMKFGVRIWPETLPDLGIDPIALKPGPNPIHLRVNALLGDKGPRKVIGLAK